MAEHLLEIQDLHTYFNTYAGLAKAVEAVSCHIDKGEMLGIVGESGCGKSVLARSILKLIPNPPGRIVQGRIIFDGRDLRKLTERQMQKIRGREIAMIFQEPMTSLNPVYTVGEQVAEVYRKHQHVSKSEALDMTEALFNSVGIPSPGSNVRAYPFQLSGGMKQRIMIAIALSCRPKLILADEPSTALDVTIQAQILELLKQLQSTAAALMLITHDLGVIAETAQRVLVMYTGKIVEHAGVAELFRNPRHPYTQGLMNSIPSLGSNENRYTARLKEIPGIVPDLCNLPGGCTFHPRCSQAKAICKEKVPVPVNIDKNHGVSCWLYE